MEVLTVRCNRRRQGLAGLEHDEGGSQRVTALQQGEPHDYCIF